MELQILYFCQVSGDKSTSSAAPRTVWTKPAQRTSNRLEQLHPYIHFPSCSLSAVNDISIAESTAEDATQLTSSTHFVRTKVFSQEWSMNTSEICHICKGRRMGQYIGYHFPPEKEQLSSLRSQSMFTRSQLSQTWLCETVCIFNFY